MAIAVVLAVVLVARGGNEPAPARSPSPPVASAPALPGEQTGSPPWDAGGAQLGPRLAAIGLPALSAEGAVVHIHQHLDIFVDGRRVTVPAAIGIDPNEQFISPLHTHDATGVIHVESATEAVFTLGQFFDVWGVRFDPSCIGGECAGGGRDLRVFSDGKPFEADPRSLVLTDHEEIVVALGTNAQLPDPIPSTYRFPKGL